MFSKTNILIIGIAIISIIILAILVFYFNLQEASVHDLPSPCALSPERCFLAPSTPPYEPTVQVPESTKSFPTQQECEQATGKQCDFKTCDFIPKGKTYEEVCGQNFRKGWMPI